jgi:hypothetical protein
MELKLKMDQSKQMALVLLTIGAVLATLYQKRSSRREWAQFVVSAAQREAKKGRVAIILCASECKVRTVSSEVPNESLFVLSERGTNDIPEGKIIVTTSSFCDNVDFTISAKSEKLGGVHVILSYQPQSIDYRCFGGLSKKNMTQSGEVYIQ